MAKRKPTVLLPGEKVIKQIRLTDITVSHNHRDPAPNLTAAFVGESVAKDDNGTAVPLSVIEFIHQYALSEYDDKRERFCTLLERYENTGPQDIVPLANSRRQNELQPVYLRSFNTISEGEHVSRYGIIAGERRILAAAYNYAKHGERPTIGATTAKMTPDKATDLALEENLKRRAPSDLEYGRYFREYKNRTNPDTGKNFTLVNIADKLGLPYQFVRTREALTYLSDAEKYRLEMADRDSNAPRVNLTAAIYKGLAIKGGKAADAEAIKDRKDNRQRVMTLAEVQKLFDSVINGTEPNNDAEKAGAYLRALAAVMKIRFEDARQESHARIKAAKKTG